MGVYDLPANLEFIENHTGQDKVIYIGHSQGMTELLVQNSINPKFGERIEAIVALAPIMYLESLSSNIYT